MGPDATYVNQDLVSPVHPVVAIDKRLCHDRAISMLIPQDILHHPSNGAIYEVGKGEFGQHGVGKRGFGQNLDATGHNLAGTEQAQGDAHHQKKGGIIHNLVNKLTGHHDTQPGGIQQPASAQNEIRQNELTHDTTHGLGGHNTLGQNNKGQLLFDFASLGFEDKDDRVLKDSSGMPIVYLTEKNRVIMRNFAITRDADGHDKIFDVSRKHMSKSPVRAHFKDLASGHTARMGAAVLEEAHGITALLWLDVGDGTKEKLPVGRIHLPTGSRTDPNVTQATDNHHKVTDAVRHVQSHHKDHAEGFGKNYQLDLMPGVDSALAALVGIVTVACADHKRRHGDTDAPVTHNTTL
ncbi:hypothetical protein Poli38472_010017 [Pythium oligandrum]|uniref:Uncharacterized protein n=1 Tax=Pythium oligandrum TaxID=41045 RepID=A0A8K1C8P0_PYTOL|nr:hypothetical protein Poli38472_010017 [Pythium oligandrum]|eukprot:TMW58458.1 hypothetical protein Poli38472_010017 [Pythium oligandrum]